MINGSGFADLGVWLMAALVLVSAVWVVALRNLFRAALSLGVVLVGVAGLFVMLEAEFLAFVQILVYVGAILTLIVFAIMLTAKLNTPGLSSTPRQPLPAAVIAGGLFAVFVTAIWRAPWPTQPMAGAPTLTQLGQALVTTLALPFEVISVVFVAVMVGAIAVAYSPAPRRPSATAKISQAG